MNAHAVPKCPHLHVDHLGRCDDCGELLGGLPPRRLRRVEVVPSKGYRFWSIFSVMVVVAAMILAVVAMVEVATVALHR